MSVTSEEIRDVLENMGFEANLVGPESPQPVQADRPITENETFYLYVQPKLENRYNFVIRWSHIENESSPESKQEVVSLISELVEEYANYKEQKATQFKESSDALKEMHSEWVFGEGFAESYEFDKWDVIEWLDQRKGWTLYGQATTVVRKHQPEEEWIAYYETSAFEHRCLIRPNDAEYTVERVADVEETELDKVREALYAYVSRREAMKDPFGDTPLDSIEKE